jgi:hypothetical protein
MIAGALFGNLPQVGNRVTVAEQRFQHTLFGAVCGLGIEIFIRAVGKK